MLITDRDREVVELLDTFKCGTPKLICEAADSYGGNLYVCRRRFNKLIKEGEGIVKRFRDNVISEYVYYTNRRPSNVEHFLMIFKAYVLFKKTPGSIEEYRVQYDLGKIIPDLYIKFRRSTGQDKYVTLYYMIECHRRSAPFNQQKYEDYYKSGAWKDIFPVFPRVIVYTNRKVTLEKSNIRYYIVDYKAPNLRECLKIL